MKKTTLVNFILDKSGSMEIIANDIIGGFNRYLKDLQKRKEKILFTLTVFDSSYHRIYTALDIKKIEPLSENNYRPNGNTALYDAAVETIEAICKEVKKMEDKPKVLTVVMTDGEENSSIKHNQKCYRDLIKELEDEDNYTFVYLGANQDSWANASAMGYSSLGNVDNWQANAKGVQAAFNNLSANTIALSASADIKTAKFMSYADDHKGIK